MSMASQHGAGLFRVVHRERFDDAIHDLAVLVQRALELGVLDEHERRQLA
ncbi:MAG: hypothetical protein ACYTGT_12080 [Planctomycetota bacterium]